MSLSQGRQAQLARRVPQARQALLEPQGRPAGQAEPEAQGETPEQAVPHPQRTARISRRQRSHTRLRRCRRTLKLL